MFRCLFVLSLLFVMACWASAADQTAAEQSKNLPNVRVEIDASIVPQPGEQFGACLHFSKSMDVLITPTVELVFPGKPPQVFTDGRWDEDVTEWTLEPVALGPNKGLGRLVVRGAKTEDGEPVARHEESLVVGNEPIQALLEKLVKWMADHPHNVGFAEAYYYRTMLAMYRITGEASYLEQAKKGTEKLLKDQHELGFWATGYNRSVYLADTGSMLGLFINIYPHVGAAFQQRIDDALARHRDLILAAGDAEHESLVHKDGSFGVGFRYPKDGKIRGMMNKPYTISTSLSGMEFFAGLYYMHGDESHKQIAERATGWLLGTMNDEGIIPYIIDNWNPKRKNVFLHYILCSSAYGGEGLIAAWTYIDDKAFRGRIEQDIKPHIEWLLRIQNPDGSWTLPDRNWDDINFDQTRGHGIVNLLVWYHTNVKPDPRIANAVRRYYLLLLDENRKSYLYVAPAKLGKSKFLVPLEHVATGIAGRALTVILKPDADIHAWKKEKCNLGSARD